MNTRNCCGNWSKQILLQTRQGVAESCQDEGEQRLVRSQGLECQSSDDMEFLYPWEQKDDETDDAGKIGRVRGMGEQLAMANGRWDGQSQG